MPDNQIDVVFGAEFSALVSAVQQIRDMLAGLSATVQGTGAQFASVSAQMGQASEPFAQDWARAMMSFDRSFETMVRGMLSGSETWQQAMGRAIDGLVAKFATAVMQMLVQWASFEALTALGFGGTAAAIGNPFQVGSGGLGGMLGSLVGGLIPSFDVGSWSVPRDMLALVHAGEMVVPADAAPAARALFAGGASSAGAATGGGVTLNVSVQAMDAAGIAQWANANAKTLAATVARYLGTNPSVGDTI